MGELTFEEFVGLHELQSQASLPTDMTRGVFCDVAKLRRLYDHLVATTDLRAALEGPASPRAHRLGAGTDLSQLRELLAGWSEHIIPFIDWQRDCGGDLIVLGKSDGFEQCVSELTAALDAIEKGGA